MKYYRNVNTQFANLVIVLTSAPYPMLATADLISLARNWELDQPCFLSVLDHFLKCQLCSIVNFIA